MKKEFHIPKIEFKPTRPLKWKRKMAKLSLVSFMIFILAIGSLIELNSFFENHYLDFQAPILFQAPVTIHNRQMQLISPLPADEPQATVSAVKTEIKVVETAPVLKKSLKLTGRAIQCFNANPKVAKKLQDAYGNKWESAVELFCKESGLNPQALNKSSGACGLVQALPCSKLKKVCPDMNVDCQIQWGKDYITDRYGDAELALNFHLNHNWY